MELPKSESAIRRLGDGFAAWGKQRMGNFGISRVLIANRGEIAVRVLRACHELGLEAVTVYSEADAAAPHVRLADQSICVGAPPSSESYLRGDRILEVAREAGCDAVHPGYGFLSENGQFARKVIDAGLAWVGPPPDAIADMGSKTSARSAMDAAGVPVVPGTLEHIDDLVELASAALEMGYPVMLKAAAGGGGKGMRRVDVPEDLEAAFLAAKSEATKSFGDGDVYIEKLIVKPRHVEVQLLADAHGNVVHLFERDCSVQRRHQKVFEETPCPALPAETREAMGQVAIQAAKAVNYVGAGTVEFLLAADGSFYFLEMNTRLQVEHPITELVTGIDLVQAQLRVAAGEPLWFRQEDLTQTGHAVECRIYAEDISHGFRPAPGPLMGYREPGGPWVRVDSGVAAGMAIPIYYDPMVAKLIVWGSDRDEALRRARRALRHYHIVGIPTSIPFFFELFNDAAFQKGDYDTGFITPEWLESHCGQPEEIQEWALLGAAVARFERDAKSPVSKSTQVDSLWKRAGRISAMGGER
jgi:acetyl-CoA carboxylase, biotin carboxylase subunit